MRTQVEDARRPQAYEPCEECGAAMDPQQRYCVNCAARRGNGANPSSRYFAAMSKRARRPLAPPPAEKEQPGSRAAAVAFFALLPIAVALGVMVGRSGNDGGDSDALLRALRERQATAAQTAAPTAGSVAAAPKAKKAAKAAAKSKGKPEEKVVAHTENGDVHEVTHFKASKQKEEEDTQLVQENPEQTGENYIKAQQNLPDVVVVGGDAGSAPAPPAGVEP
ncbi:MAG TPA: hypothetical protein VN732_07020 [Solirubrobacterales bacterium]|nr:hypothetical protein [Solirubrobacterales bacterium]